MPEEEYSFIPYMSDEYDENEMLERSREFYKWSDKR